MFTVRLLHSLRDVAAAEKLLMRVWLSESPQLDAPTLRALAHAGNYVAGAFRDNARDELVGCAVGFFAPPSELSLHSHIAGVDPRFAGSGVGALLKNHQRTWCLDNGLTAMTWTFDPAIARNAYFNIAKLGVRVVDYLQDFYGPLHDGRNQGSPTDRLFVRWELESTRRDPAVLPPVAVALGLGPTRAPVPAPVDPVAQTVLLEVPTDIERMRQEAPELAADWRLAIRHALAPYVASPDWSVVGFLKTGSYVVRRNA